MSEVTTKLQAPHEPSGESSEEEASEDRDTWLTRVRSRSGALVVLGLSAVLAVPMLVGLAVMYRPRWMPLGEVAQMEMRVRDVTSLHPPLLGLNGRFEAYGQVGSHPGALAYYVLAPVYRLFGSDGWGLMVSTATAAVAAGTLAVLFAYRRGGWQAALGVTAVLVVLMRAYTAQTLAEAWNPYVPLVWWVAFLVTVWAALDGDLVALPVAVFTGSLCAQTHVPYVPLVVAMFLMLAVAGGLVLRREGREVLSRRVLTWVGASVALGVVLWTPPVIQQLTNDPGNVAILVQSFQEPFDERVSLDVAFNSWASHFDMSELVSGRLLALNRIVPGLVLLAVWGAAAAVAVRRADRAVVRLHIVLGVVAVAGLVATTRIHGPLWSYLVTWGWGLTALVVFATGWTFWRALPVQGERFAAAAVGIATVAAVVLFSLDARDAEMYGSDLSRRLDQEAAATLDYLAADPAGCGDSCTYQVTWADPLYIGSEGVGLLMELERRGLDVGAAPYMAEPVRHHRVVDDDEADAVIHVAVTKESIDNAAAAPGAVEIASFDIYPPEVQASHAELRAELVAELEAEGYEELTEQASTTTGNRLLPLDEGMSHDLKMMIMMSNAIYRPSAVFFTPSQGNVSA